MKNLISTPLICILLLLFSSCGETAIFPKDIDAESLKVDENQGVLSAYLKVYSLHVHDVDGRFSDAKGKALIHDNGEGNYSLAFYKPTSSGGLKRMHEPITVKAVTPPYSSTMVDLQVPCLVVEHGDDKSLYVYIHKGEIKQKIM